MEEPVAGEFGEIFAKVKAGIDTDDGDDFGGFVLITLLHVVDGKFGVFGGKVSELVEGGSGVAVFDGDELFGVVCDAGGGVTGDFGSATCREAKVDVIFEGLEGGEPAGRDEVVSGEEGIAAAVTVDIPGRSFAGGDGVFVGVDVGIVGLEDGKLRESFELIDEDGEVGFADGIVRLDAGVDESEQDAGGAGVSIDGAVGSGATGADVRVELGGVRVDAEGWEQNVPGDRVGESVVFFEVTFLGGGEVAGFHERVNVGLEASLLGDGLDEIGGLGFGGGLCGFCGFCGGGYGEHGETKTKGQYKGKDAGDFWDSGIVGITDGFESFHDFCSFRVDGAELKDAGLCWVRVGLRAVLRDGRRRWLGNCLIERVKVRRGPYLAIF